MFKSIKEADLGNKKVLMRVGFDVPVDGEGKVLDDTRIKESLPSIKYVLKQRPKELTLIAHLGRPEGKPVENLKLQFVAQHVAKLLDLGDIEETESKIDIDEYRLASGFHMLENIRFNPEEEENDPRFAKRLASLGEIFIFEAFSAAHRRHASTTGIMQHLPTYFGYEFEREIKNLKKILEGPESPFVVVIGGAKTEDKVPVIDNLGHLADKILVGGRTSNLLRKEGKYKDDEKVILHTDGISQQGEAVKASDNPMAALDIGPKTVSEFKRLLTGSETVLVAGPLGKFEEEKFKEGTKEIYEFITDLDAYKLAAGGDTIEALNKFKLYKKFDFVSTGGGAALDFLSTGTLPVLEIKK